MNTHKTLTVEIFSLGSVSTNTYLVTCTITQHCILIDAPMNSATKILSLIQNRGHKLIGVFITHGHWDHIADAATFQKAGVPLYGHRADACFFEHATSMQAYMPTPYAMKSFKIDHFVSDKQILNLLGVDIQVLHTPGHGPGNIVFYFKSLDIAFSGDVLFRESVGRTDLPMSDFDALKHSIKDTLYQLPDETILYCGHGIPTTIGHEKFYNPFVSKSN